MLNIKYKKKCEKFCKKNTKERRIVRKTYLKTYFYLQFFFFFLLYKEKEWISAGLKLKRYLKFSTFQESDL